MKRKAIVEIVVESDADTDARTSTRLQDLLIKVRGLGVQVTDVDVIRCEPTTRADWILELANWWDGEEPQNIREEVMDHLTGYSVTLRDSRRCENTLEWFTEILALLDDPLIEVLGRCVMFDDEGRPR